MPLKTHSYFRACRELAMTPLARQHFDSSDHNEMVAGPKGKILAEGILSPFIHDSQCEVYYLLFNINSTGFQRLAKPLCDNQVAVPTVREENSDLLPSLVEKCGPMVTSTHINFFPFTSIIKGEVSPPFVYGGNI